MVILNFQKKDILWYILFFRRYLLQAISQKTLREANDVNSSIVIYTFNFSAAILKPL